jgi:hypothetical protein
MDSLIGSVKFAAILPFIIFLTDSDTFAIGALINELFVFTLALFPLFPLFPLFTRFAADREFAAEFILLDKTNDCYNEFLHFNNHGMAIK